MAERELLWSPSAEAVANASITRYQEWLSGHHGVHTADYQELWRWSTEQLECFWASLLEYFEVTFDRAPERVLAERSMPRTRWCAGAELNYAANIFRERDPEAMAIQHCSEARPLSSWSWADLAAETAAIAAGLRRRGIGPGDRVAAYMPNIPETVAAFLACASIGAIWSCAAPEFGASSVTDRFSQIEPKLVILVDGYRYGGRDFDRREAGRQIIAALPHAPLAVHFGYLDGSGWEDGFIGPPRAHGPTPECTPLPFDHPLWILYSSGTTGLPKALVHSHGGILLEQLKICHLHLDAKPADRVFWFSTTGWMMWNFLIGVLLTDASIVLYDGQPELERMWDLAAEAGVTCFGTSAAFIGACMKAGTRPRQGRDLAPLRAVGSTGSPLSPEGFRWVYDEIGADTWLFSTSGGTDLCTAFLTGVPTLPVRAGEIQARALGAAIESWSEDGRSLTGEVGELVITEPMPSMPVFLWGDLEDERYLDSYFSAFPGVWRHGDWLELTPEGGAVIHGRSDSTINRGGVRMGTSEIYRVVLALDEILDALVIDLPRADGGGSIELFVTLRPGGALTDELQARVRQRLRDHCSPRHVPDRITQIAEVPRTLSGKALEIPVKRILSGAPVERVVSREALANPAALEPFVQMAKAGWAAIA